MEIRWNDTEKGKPRYSKEKKNLRKCHSVHHECHMDYPQFESKPRLRRGLYGLPWHGRERSGETLMYDRETIAAFCKKYKEHISIVREKCWASAC
jgi:hypothetical protein